MNRDRGSIKWNSMMLPEHVKMMRDWAERDEMESRAEMDEQMLEEWIVVLRSLRTGQEVTVDVYNGHRYETVSGTVISFSAERGALTLSCGQASRTVQLQNLRRLEAADLF